MEEKLHVTEVAHPLPILMLYGSFQSDCPAN